MLKVFIGYDDREVVAYHVLCQSILQNISGPVEFIPIKKDLIIGYNRKENGSTQFTYSRFLTPYLSGYAGTSIFMDCDMLVRADLYDLLALTSRCVDVSVVKHDYVPNSKDKFLGNKQVAYPRKNWSSLMVFNNYTSACRSLTPEYVSRASGADLHRFLWCRDERIGELPREWNHLVGEYPQNRKAKIVHFTLGTPCFKGYDYCEYSMEWYAELDRMTSCAEPKSWRFKNARPQEQVKNDEEIH